MRCGLGRELHVEANGPMMDFARQNGQRANGQYNNDKDWQRGCGRRMSGIRRIGARGDGRFSDERGHREDGDGSSDDTAIEARHTHILICSHTLPPALLHERRPSDALCIPVGGYSRSRGVARSSREIAVASLNGPRSRNVLERKGGELAFGELWGAAAVSPHG
jgi:hypothetical protein